MVVVVTGARSGIGREICVAAAARGHVVYAGLRDPSTGGELLSRATGDVRPLPLDVTDAAQRDAAIARIVAEEGRIDALVNNAGVALGGVLEEVDEDELRRVLDVNVVATWAMTRAVLPVMRARRAGRIVNVSSASGRMAIPCLGVYATSKFALEGMSEAMRHELRPWGVDVVLVEPGAYATDIWTRNRTLSRSASRTDSPYGAYRAAVDAFVSDYSTRNMRPPAEVGAYIVDLLEARGRPRLRHPIGPGARMRELAVRLLPFGLIERVVDRAVSRGARLLPPTTEPPRA